MQVIALANQKGGTAKSTSTVHLGAALAEMGKRVLLCDLDPQGHLAAAFGLKTDDLKWEMAEVLNGRCNLAQARLKGVRPNLDLVPTDRRLADLSYALVRQAGRDTALTRAMATLGAEYDWVLLDCQPSLGVLTVNALMAAQGLLIPMNTQYTSMLGVKDLLETVHAVQARGNPALKIWGVIPTQTRRTLHSREVLEYVETHLGGRGIHIYQAVPDSTRFQEAFGKGKTVFELAPEVPGALAYRQIAEDMIKREESARA